MHQQIRTSPGSTGENIRRVLDILAAEDVNVDGIGPDFEAPHVRLVVDHDHVEAAWSALKRNGLEPEMRAAVAFGLTNAPGQLAAAMERLARRGYAAESVLVLAARDGDRVLVSIGVRSTVPDGWEATSADLGATIDPGGEGSSG